MTRRVARSLLREDTLDQIKRRIEAFIIKVMERLNPEGFHVSAGRMTTLTNRFWMVARKNDYTMDWRDNGSGLSPMIAFQAKHYRDPSGEGDVLDKLSISAMERLFNEHVEYFISRANDPNVRVKFPPRPEPKSKPEQDDDTPLWPEWDD